MGFFVPRRSRAGRWALTPPFHPCRTPREAVTGGLLFCDTFRRPRLAPRGRPHVLRGMSPCGVRTFLPAPAKQAPGDRLPSALTKLRPEHRLDKGIEPQINADGRRFCPGNGATAQASAKTRVNRSTADAPPKICVQSALICGYPSPFRGSEEGRHQEPADHQHRDGKFRRHACHRSEEGPPGRASGREQALAAEQFPQQYPRQRSNKQPDGAVE